MHWYLKRVRNAVPSKECNYNLCPYFHPFVKAFYMTILKYKLRLHNLKEYKVIKLSGPHLIFLVAFDKWNCSKVSYISFNHLINIIQLISSWFLVKTWYHKGITSWYNSYSIRCTKITWYSLSTSLLTILLPAHAFLYPHYSHSPKNCLYYCSNKKWFLCRQIYLWGMFACAIYIYFHIPETKAFNSFLYTYWKNIGHCHTWNFLDVYVNIFISWTAFLYWSEYIYFNIFEFRLYMVRQRYLYRKWFGIKLMNDMILFIVKGLHYAQWSYPLAPLHPS